MRLSAASLQEQLDALQQLCPVLQPSVLPAGYDARDLSVLVAHPETKGRRSEAATAQLAALQEQAATAGGAGGSSCARCGVCGAEDVLEASASGSGGGDGGVDEDALLRLVGTWRVYVAEKQLRLEGVQLACGLCRALQDTRGIVAAMTAACVDPGDEGRVARVGQLERHLLTANHPPGAASDSAAALLSDEVAARAWFQEVYTRAYSLTVLTSHIRGWQLANTAGTPLPLAGPKRAAAAVAAAEQLLKQRRQQERKQRQSGQQEQASPAGSIPLTAAAKGGTGKAAAAAKRKAAAGGGGEQQQVGGPSLKRRPAGASAGAKLAGGRVAKKGKVSSPAAPAGAKIAGGRVAKKGKVAISAVATSDRDRTAKQQAIRTKKATLKKARQA